MWICAQLESEVRTKCEGVEAERTSAVKPSPDDERVDSVCVDDMGKARGIEVACARIDGDALQVNLGRYTGEADITKPTGLTWAFGLGQK